MPKSPAGYVRVTAFPAAYGDALWVEYGRGRDTHRLLIDGGPASTYATVRAWLERLTSAERRIELFVVTHIDADHIDGAILLLQEFRSLKLSFEDVWFNGWRHLQENTPQPQDDVFAPIQGEFLGALIEDGRLRWNAAFSSAAVVVPETGPLPTRQLPGGASLTLVSPQQRQLRRLRRNWDTVARDAGWSPGDTEGARDRLSKRQDYVPPARIDVFGGEAYQPDNSVANGSSIAFAFEYKDIKCLFTGDAVTDCLTTGLKRLAAERGTDAVHFDLVKLPHHGSAKNVDKRLAELMPADRFLISTNGARYHHPDAEAIKLVLERHAAGGQSRQPQLYFNYQSKTTEEWGNPNLQSNFSYGAFFPPDGPGITVTLGELSAGKRGENLVRAIRLQRRPRSRRDRLGIGRLPGRRGARRAPQRCRVRRARGGRRRPHARRTRRPHRRLPRSDPLRPPAAGRRPRGGAP
jgi:beta-lactamase superfamily II metal-dependent hydrolase